MVGVEKGAFLCAHCCGATASEQVGRIAIRLEDALFDLLGGTNQERPAEVCTAVQGQASGLTFCRTCTSSMLMPFTCRYQAYNAKFKSLHHYLGENRGLIEELMNATLAVEELGSMEAEVGLL